MQFILLPHLKTCCVVRQDVDVEKRSWQCKMVQWAWRLLTLLFMMALRHMMQTWMSSLGSPILSLAACLYRFMMSGLSMVSSGGLVWLVEWRVEERREHTPGTPIDKTTTSHGGCKTWEGQFRVPQGSILGPILFFNQTMWTEISEYLKDLFLNRFYFVFKQSTLKFWSPSRVLEDHVINKKKLKN